MTSTRYYIARLTQVFGFSRRNQRMSEAASEMHLLREAEAQLGAQVWEKVENIEELSVEYWNLRKLIKERDLVRKKLEDCQAKLDRAHEQRVNLLNTTPEILQALVDERIALLFGLEELASQRDQIVAQAREVRRAYDGMKMKLEVISKEFAGQVSGKQEIDGVKARLVELKSDFSSLKRKRIEIGEKIEAGDAKVDVVDGKISEYKKQQRSLASGAFETIGERNKEITGLRAESAVLDTQMRQLYADIGRFVSRHTQTHPGCGAAVASERGLVEVMRALRHSIALNHRLAGIT